MAICHEPGEVVPTNIKATCPTCQDVSLPIERVTLRYLNGTPYDGAEYRFVCPRCSKIILKPCSPEIANLLYTSGIKVEKFELSLELLERPQEIDAAPISDDDVIDLGLELENNEEEWMNRMQWGRGSEDQ